jgi:hypothetical protein
VFALFAVRRRKKAGAGQPIEVSDVPDDADEKCSSDADVKQAARLREIEELMSDVPYLQLCHEVETADRRGDREVDLSPRSSPVADVRGVVELDAVVLKAMLDERVAQRRSELLHLMQATPDLASPQTRQRCPSVGQRDADQFGGFDGSSRCIQPHASAFRNSRKRATGGKRALRNCRWSGNATQRLSHRLTS